MIALKKERVEFRVPLEVKNTLEEAAQFSKLSLSQFVTESALSRAQEVIEEQRRLQIDEDQWEAVMSALENPPEPNKMMQDIIAMSMEESWTVQVKPKA